MTDVKFSELPPASSLTGDDLIAVVQSGTSKKATPTMVKDYVNNLPFAMNPSRITSDSTISSNYNASSIGPIEIAQGVTVTVSSGATWRVI